MNEHEFMTILRPALYSGSETWKLTSDERSFWSHKEKYVSFGREKQRRTACRNIKQTAEEIRRQLHIL
jgi:hypothetical protein